MPMSAHPRRRRRGHPRGKTLIGVVVIFVLGLLWVVVVDMESRHLQQILLYHLTPSTTPTPASDNLDMYPPLVPVSWARKGEIKPNTNTESVLTDRRAPTVSSSPTGRRQHIHNIDDDGDDYWNVTNLKLADMTRFENTSVCPELMAAATFVTEATDLVLPLKYNILMIQLVGSFHTTGRGRLRDNTTAIRRAIYESNARLLRKQGNMDVMMLDKRPSNTSGLLPVNFWKMDAMIEHCVNRDLVWLLDSDVILKETVAVDVLWAYHNHYAKQAGAEQLDLLLPKDWRGIYTGSMIVNCRSSTALDFLRQWKDLAIRSSLQTFASLPTYMSYVEEHAAHELHALLWLLDAPHGKPPHPFLARQNDTALQKHARTRVHSTMSPCALATYHAMLYCKTKAQSEKLEEGGRVWWEPGHQALHISKDVAHQRRNAYLTAEIPNDLVHVFPTATIKASASVYLKHHANKPSINPLEHISHKQCREEDKKFPVRFRTRSGNTRQ